MILSAWRHVAVLRERGKSNELIRKNLMKATTRLMLGA
jgi:hypothetical protein